MVSIYTLINWMGDSFQEQVGSIRHEKTVCLMKEEEATPSNQLAYITQLELSYLFIFKKYVVVRVHLSQYHLCH